MFSIQVSIMPATSHTEAFVGVGSQVPGLIATGCHVTPIPAPVSAQMGKAGKGLREVVSPPSSHHTQATPGAAPGGNGNGGTLVLGEVPGCVVVDLQGNDIVVQEPASAAASAAQYLVDQPIVVRLSRTQTHTHSPSNAPHTVQTHTNAHTHGHTHTHLPSDATHAVHTHTNTHSNTHTQSHVSSSNNNITITNSSSQADIHISHPATHHTNHLNSHSSSSIHHASSSNQQVSNYSGTDGTLGHNYHRGKEGYGGEGRETTSATPQSKSQVKVEVDIDPKWIIRPVMTNPEVDSTEDSDRPRRTSAKKARQRWKTLHEDGGGAVRAGARRTKKLSNLPRKKPAARTERMEVKILVTLYICVYIILQFSP